MKLTKLKKMEIKLTHYKSILTNHLLTKFERIKVDLRRRMFYAGERYLMILERKIVPSQMKNIQILDLL